VRSANIRGPRPATRCACTVRIRVLHFDQPAAIAAFGTEPTESHDAGLDGRVRTLVFAGADTDRPLIELAARRIVFDGEHSAGLDYPGRLFASQHGELRTVDQPYSVVSAPIDLETLEVDPAALDSIRAYKILADRVWLILEHRQPLDIAVSALQLKEVGEIEPWHRLLGTLRIASVAFHVDAIAVECTARHGQQPVGADLQASFAAASEGLRTEDGFSEITLATSDGRRHDYVILIHPYDR
jgi:hypothetical protein